MGIPVSAHLVETRSCHAPRLRNRTASSLPTRDEKMRNMGRRLLAGASLFVAGTAVASTGAASDFDVPRVSQTVQTLSSEAYEGRGPAPRATTNNITYNTSPLNEAVLTPRGTPTHRGRQRTQEVPQTHPQ